MRLGSQQGSGLEALRTEGVDRIRRPRARGSTWVGLGAGVRVVFQAGSLVLTLALDLTLTLT